MVVKVMFSKGTGYEFDSGSLPAIRSIASRKSTSVRQSQPRISRNLRLGGLECARAMRADRYGYGGRIRQSMV